MREDNNTNTRQLAAYSLSLSVNRYAKWLGSLQSAVPCSLSAADHDIRLISNLRDQHFRRIARHIDDLILGHQRLREALGGEVQYTNCPGSREVDHVAPGAYQTQVVNRLLSIVSKYLAASPGPTAGVLVLREVISNLPRPAHAATSTNTARRSRTAS